MPAPRRFAPEPDDTASPGRSDGPAFALFAALFPVVAVFGVAEWLSFTNSGSFAGILGLLGVLVDSLMAGIFPALLLAASRRKGDIVPGVSYHFLGHPLLLITIYLLFLANLFFHGLVIWQNPIQRAGGIVVGLLILGLTLLMLRRRAFAPRLVVELRAAQSDSHPANLAIVDNGQPAVAEVRLGYTDGAESIKTAALEIPKFPTLRFLNLRLPSTQARELKLWTHRLTPEGDTAALPALNKVHPGPKIVMEAVVAPHSPQVAVILGFRSIEEFWSVRAKLNADKELEKASEAWQAGPEPPFEQMTSALLEATDYSPEIVALDPPPVSPRLFELRVYHSPTYSQLRALHERFAGPEIQLFHKHGVHPILYTSTVVGPQIPNLTYVIPFADLAAREKAWAAFGANPRLFLGVLAVEAAVGIFLRPRVLAAVRAVEQPAHDLALMAEVLVRLEREIGRASCRERV